MDVTKSDGITFADVHFKDGNNSGFAKGLGRFLGRLIEGYLTAAAGSAQQTYNSDFSDIDNMVSAFVGADGYYHLQTSTDYPIRIYTGVKFIENFDYNVTVIGYDN